MIGGTSGEDGQTYPRDESQISRDGHGVGLDW